MRLITFCSHFPLGMSSYFLNSISEHYGQVTDQNVDPILFCDRLGAGRNTASVATSDLLIYGHAHGYGVTGNVNNGTACYSPNYESDQLYYNAGPTRHMMLSDHFSDSYGHGNVNMTQSHPHRNILDNGQTAGSDVNSCLTVGLHQTTVSKQRNKNAQDLFRRSLKTGQTFCSIDNTSSIVIGSGSENTTFDSVNKTAAHCNITRNDKHANNNNRNVSSSCQKVSSNQPEVAKDGAYFSPTGDFSQSLTSWNIYAKCHSRQALSQPQIKNMSEATLPSVKKNRSPDPTHDQIPFEHQLLIEKRCLSDNSDDCQSDTDVKSSFNIGGGGGGDNSTMKLDDKHGPPQIYPWMRRMQYSAGKSIAYIYILAILALFQQS